METTLSILVLIIVIAVFIGVGYLYTRSSGGRAWRNWFVAPASLRQTVGNLIGPAGGQSPDRATGNPIDVNETAPIRNAHDEGGTVTLAYDDTALATLENELRSDLDAHRERQQAIDSRMRRIEVAISEIRTIPDDLGDAMRLRDRRTRRQVEQLRAELEGVRRGATAAGARKDEAYTDLYGYLAQIEASLGSALNPMFLPGEPLTLPETFASISLEAENWDEVGEHALEFGKAFNQSRLVLDNETSMEIEAFLTTLRQAMTGAVYPTVRRSAPSRSQLAQMRNGLESIIEALAPVRRRLEETYRGSTPPVVDDVPDDDDLDDA